MSVRSSTAVCASIALVSGTVTANLWLELRSGREVTAGLRAELARSLDRIAAAQALIKSPPSSSELPAADIADAAAPVVIESRVPPTRAVASGTVTYTVNAHVSEQQLLQNQEYRKAHLAALRAAIVHSHPGLAEALGLTQKQADALFDLLAETQLERITQPLALTGDPETDRALIVARNQNDAELQREQGEALRTMLGDEGYAHWQQYLPTRSVRVQADSYATTLAKAGAPLNGAQLKGLVGAMLEEQKSLRDDIVALGRKVDATNPVSREQTQIALRDRQAASNHRILDATSAQLTAQQLALLRAQFQQGDAIREASARTWERVDSVLLQR